MSTAAGHPIQGGASDQTGRPPVIAPEVLAPAQLGPVRLRNRVIKAATFEGLSHKGLVTRDLVDFHVRVARGGAAMTTIGASIVSDGGCTSPHQIVWRPKAVPGLRRLAEAVHAEGAAISAQLVHGGPVANPKLNRRPALAPSRHFHATSLSWSHAASPEEIAGVVRDFGEAARLVVDAGFDAIEIHLGHNYLASSFLSPRINKRTDSYGGSLENRARLAREICRSVRDAVGGQVAILAKLNMDDGAAGGFWVDEAIPVAQWLDADGGIDALEMTAGSSLLNPMYLFKGAVPMREFAAVMPQPVKLGVRLFGKAKLKEYPYTDGYLLEDARQIRAAVDLPMVLLGGVTDRPMMDRAMAEGFEFVAMARALLREPDLVNRIGKDAATRSLCIHCNKCMPTNFVGTRCVLVERSTPRGVSWGTPEGYVS